MTILFIRPSPLKLYQLGSVQLLSCVHSDSLQPHRLQHARLPCPSPTPGACSNSCPSSQWCHPTISSSVVPFSSCLWSFPASVFSSELVLPIRWPKYRSFTFSISISPSNEYSGLISLGLTGLISLQSKGLTITIQHNHQFSPVQLLSHVQLFETYGLQHAKPPCPSPTPGVYPNSCPLS